jgi:rfaE bifunctional protein kinase chain/domain
MDTARSIQNFPSRRVLVVGDLMLDEAVTGDVSRISPEAPVPVLEVTGRTSTAGGAANAAANVASLGGRAALVGLVGDDAAGKALVRHVEELRVDASGILVDPARPTTQKTRIVARGQQVVRIDSESRAPASAETTGELSRIAAAALAGADACVVSDYGKGVVTAELVAAIVAGARARSVPVIVDPKRKDFSVYRGATVVTPNLNELEAATGRPCHTTDEVVAAASALLEQLDGCAVLVTRGAAGMTLLEPGAPPVHTPARAREVFYVTGAGDTVVGTLALALASKIPLATAIEIAGVAAGLVVSKMGTATVSQGELRAELEKGR